MDSDFSEARPLRVLFVCTGNTCRSPMAEVLARSLSGKDGLPEVEARSAGTLASPGFPASEGALGAASRNGLDLTGHRSSCLSPELVAWADHVFTMDRSHMIRAEEMDGEGKTVVLGSFAQGLSGGSGEFSLPDPFGGADWRYDETFRTLEIYVRRALERIAFEEDREWLG